MKIINAYRDTPDSICFTFMHDDGVRRFTTGELTRYSCVCRPLTPAEAQTVDGILFTELDALLRADFDFIMSLPLPSEKNG